MSTPDSSSANFDNGDALTSPRSLAELARSGFSIVRQPSMRVAYEVHHVADHPGYLFGVLQGNHQAAGEDVEAADEGDTAEEVEETTGPSERFIETLTSAAHGSGLVVGTRTIAAGADTPIPLGMAHPVFVERVPRKARKFSGSAVPNVSFVYEASHVFEGLIAVGTRETTVQRRHGRALLEVMATVAKLAANTGHAPVLSLQSPVQLPPKKETETAKEGEEHDEMAQDTKPRNWPRSSAIAVRFAIALSRPTAHLRLRLLDEVSKFCEDSGFSFWAADTRSDFRAGNWFSICQHDQEKLDQYYERDPSPDDLLPPEWSLPLTFVGPARVGATKSIVEYLRSYPQLGVVACSMSIVDDVAFIHVQLTANTIRPADLPDLNKLVDGYAIGPQDRHRLQQTDSLSLLREIIPVVARAKVELPPTKVVADLTRKVGDFQLLVGPARKLPSNLDTLRRALWVSWEVEGRGAELSVPFLALWHVVQELVPENGEKDGPNVEYLICRRVRHAILRGKGKISFSDRLRKVIATGDIQAGLTSLSERIEEAWRAKLDAKKHRVRELTVSWRENWLGHWTSPLD